MTSLASDTSSVTLKSTDLLPDHTSPSPALSSPVVSRPVPIPEENANPWLATPDGQTSKAVQKKHEVAVGKESGTVATWVYVYSQWFQSRYTFLFPARRVSILK